MFICVCCCLLGMQGAILLSPVLCPITGLSDEKVANFNVMKDIAVFNRYLHNNMLKVSLN